MSEFSHKSSKDVVTVIQAHAAWKNKIKSVAQGVTTETYSPETVALDDQCVLGKWIYSIDDQSVKSSEKFKELRDAHKEFHKIASNTLSMALQGKNKEALDEMAFGDFAKKSIEVTKLITNLYKN